MENIVNWEVEMDDRTKPIKLEEDQETSYSESNTYTCENCPYKCLSSLELQEHIKNCASLDDTFVKCKICGKLCPSKRSFNKHIKCHTSERKYKCEKCPKDFRVYSHLSAHLETHVPIYVRDKIDCKFCDKSFTTECGHRQHQRVHSDLPLPALCEVCGNLYASLTGLKIHQRAHWEIEKKHICDICGKRFSGKSAMEIHIKVHKDIRDFKCEECGKTFVKRENFRRHLRIHSGYRPHQCSYCDKSFSKRYKVKSHERIHSGEKPYLCDMCPDAFSQNVSLRNHKKRYHKETTTDSKIS